MNKTAQAGMLVMLVLTLDGCSSDRGFLGRRDLASGEPRISDAVWLQTQDVHVDQDKTKPNDYFDDDKYLPATCIKPTEDPSTHTFAYKRPYAYVSQNPMLASCIAQMKILIDLRYEHWIDSLNAWNSGSNTILDNVVIGAGIAGTAAGGLASQVFNAISASLTGAKSTVNNDIFYQKSVQIIITQMQTDRSKWDTIIQNRLQATQKSGQTCSTPASPEKLFKPSRKDPNKTVSFSSEKASVNELANTTTTTTIVMKPNSPDVPILPYCNLNEAWDDLKSYARQGSFNNALLTLTANVSAQSAACQAENLNTRQASAATTMTGANQKVTDATAVSLCPTSSSTNSSNSTQASPAPANVAKGK